MGIEVDHGVIDRFQKHPPEFLAAIRIKTSEVDAALEGLAPLAERYRTSYRSCAVIAGDDELVLVFWSVSAALPRHAPLGADIEAALRDSGVENAVVRTTRVTDRLTADDGEGAKALVLRLYPLDAHGRVPVNWADEADRWLARVAPGQQPVTIRARGLKVAAAGRGRALRSAALTGGLLGLYHRSADAEVLADISHPPPRPRLTLGVATEDANRVLDLAQGLIDIAAQLAPLSAYSSLAIERTLRGAMMGSEFMELEDVVDELVPDAFPAQILTPRHLNRLTLMPRCSEVSPDRFLVQFGTALEWWTSAPGRDDYQAWRVGGFASQQGDGRALLERILANYERASAIRAARRT